MPLGRGWHQRPTIPPLSNPQQVQLLMTPESRQHFRRFQPIGGESNGTLCSVAPAALHPIRCGEAGTPRSRHGTAGSRPCQGRRATVSRPQHDPRASRTMSARIVTSTYRYKRPPRKRKAVPLEGAGDRGQRSSVEACAEARERDDRELEVKYAPPDANCGTAPGRPASPCWRTRTSSRPRRTAP
jgi:hypothetical protein